jgi:DNA repair protein RadC
MPVEERPRERLIHFGAEALSNQELLAILLRTGTARESALSLAGRILSSVGGLKDLAQATIQQLSTVNGVGPAKAVEIRAAVELGKRICTLTDDARPTIRSPADASQLLMSELRFQAKEHFRALLLDAKNQVIRILPISVGSLTESIVHPRELFREAIRYSSAALIVAHNHPSGDPTPSPEDIATTRRLIEVGRIVGIELLDHVILGDGRFVSLKERGFIS